MGQDLEASQGTAPSFLIWAMRDKNAAPLQRVQIIKGWVDRISGRPHEQVIDVACSDGLTPDPITKRYPDNDALVDISDCSISSDRGANEIKTVWTDDSFDSTVKSFYYVRVLENPSCRWSTWDAVKNGTRPREDYNQRYRSGRGPLQFGIHINLFVIKGEITCYKMTQNFLNYPCPKKLNRLWLVKALRRKR